VTRLCAWCENPILARARREAVCCSVRCRQARHRFLRAVGYADSVGPSHRALVLVTTPGPSPAPLPRRALPRPLPRTRLLPDLVMDGFCQGRLRVYVSQAP